MSDSQTICLLRHNESWLKQNVADAQPRLAVNSVTAQNFALPPRIASFMQDVFSAFTSLNLRNDALRRKFDSIKYGVARCEDVVYDLTLRGLT